MKPARPAARHRYARHPDSRRLDDRDATFHAPCMEMNRMDATKLLTEDHKKVRAALAELAKTSERDTDKREELLGEIALDLEVHTQIEEEIFYPAFRKASGDDENDKLYFEALEEHRAVGDLVLPDLQNTPTSSEKFGGRAKVLKELVDHHADEEEETMFKRARKLFSSDELEKLGKQLASRKEELIREHAEAE
ncbi:MAG: Repair of Iron Centers di-iron protein [Rhodanobacteraceae bacterium]|nr:MAG: Repair of Iron Centers di-iron protein [Rhodanobacteraceae bacterium]